jgi:integrase
MKRPFAKRDRAICLLLLDTGIRVSECARLTMQDITYPSGMDSIPQGDVVIRPFGSGRKSKGRVVHITAATIKKALMIYHAEDREDSLCPGDPAFLNKERQAMNRHSIRRMLKRAGERAGVQDVHPHRFRHTPLLSRSYAMVAILLCFKNYWGIARGRL